jgi:hypothetical protein
MLINKTVAASPSLPREWWSDARHYQKKLSV